MQLQHAGFSVQALPRRRSLREAIRLDVSHCSTSQQQAAGTACRSAAPSGPGSQDAVRTSNIQQDSADRRPVANSQHLERVHAPQALQAVGLLSLERPAPAGSLPDSPSPSGLANGTAASQHQQLLSAQGALPVRTKQLDAGRPVDSSSLDMEASCSGSSGVSGGFLREEGRLQGRVFGKKAKRRKRQWPPGGMQLEGPPGDPGRLWDTALVHAAADAPGSHLSPSADLSNGWGTSESVRGRGEASVWEGAQAEGHTEQAGQRALSAQAAGPRVRRQRRQQQQWLNMQTPQQADVPSSADLHLTYSIKAARSCQELQDLIGAHGQCMNHVHVCAMLVRLTQLPHAQPPTRILVPPPPAEPGSSPHPATRPRQLQQPSPHHQPLQQVLYPRHAPVERQWPLSPAPGPTPQAPQQEQQPPPQQQQQVWLNDMQEPVAAAAQQQQQQQQQQHSYHHLQLPMQPQQPLLPFNQKLGRLRQRSHQGSQPQQQVQQVHDMPQSQLHPHSPVSPNRQQQQARLSHSHEPQPPPPPCGGGTAPSLPPLPPPPPLLPPTPRPANQGQLVVLLARLARQQLPHMGFWELSSSMASLVKLRAPLKKSYYISFMEAATHRFKRRGKYGSPTPQALTQLLWAVARCGMRNLRSDWADMFLWAVEDVWREFDMRSSVRLLHGLACLKHTPPPPFMDMLLKRVQASLPDARTQDLANVLWALARLRQPPPPAFTHAWLAATQPRMAAAGPQELPSMLWALGRLHITPPPAWTAAALEHAAQLLPSLNSQGISLTVYAVGLMRVQPPPAWLRGMLDAAAARGFSGFGPQSMALLVFGTCGLLRAAPPPGWLPAFHAALESMPQRFEPAGLDLIHEAFRAAGFVPRRTSHLPTRASPSATLPTHIAGDGGSSSSQSFVAPHAGGLQSTCDHSASSAQADLVYPVAASSSGGDAWSAQGMGRTDLLEPWPFPSPLAAANGAGRLGPLPRDQAGWGSSGSSSSGSSSGVGPRARVGTPVLVPGTGIAKVGPRSHAAPAPPPPLPPLPQPPLGGVQDVGPSGAAPLADGSSSGGTSSTSNLELRQTLLLLAVDKDGEWEGTGLAASRSLQPPPQQKPRQRLDAEAKERAARQQRMQGGVQKPSRFR